MRFESNESNLHGFRMGGKDLMRYIVLFAILVTDGIGCVCYSLSDKYLVAAWGKIGEI